MTIHDILARTLIAPVFHDDACATFQVFDGDALIFDDLASYATAVSAEYGYAAGVLAGVYPRVICDNVDAALDAIAAL